MSVAREWPPKTPPLRPPQWSPPGLPGPSPSRLPMVLPTAEALETGLASRLLHRRIVLVTGRIDTDTAADVVATLLLLDEDSHRPIRLHLSTDDAELEAAALVADTVDLLASPVHVVALGTVGSAALGVLAAAGTRSAHPQALFVLRDPQHVAALGAGDVDAGRAAGLADQQQRLLARLHRRVADATGRTVEQVAGDMRVGRILSAADALDYGLVQQLAGRSGPDGLH